MLAKRAVVGVVMEIVCVGAASVLRRLLGVLVVVARGIDGAEREPERAVDLEGVRARRSNMPRTRPSF